MKSTNPKIPRLRLITRADDAGSAQAVNEGIHDAASKGIIRNISVMTVGPALEHASLLLANLPNVCIGLHLTINSEWPALPWRPASPPTDIPSLVEKNGTFTNHPLVLHYRGFSLDDLRRETLAQLHLLRKAGFHPCYLDTHMGFDWLPGVQETLSEICRQQNLILDAQNTWPRLPGVGRPLLERITTQTGGPFILITHPARDSHQLNLFSNDSHPPGVERASRSRELQALLSDDFHQNIQLGNLSLERYC